ncbi:MAG: SLBB domain-containing protein [Steroidobacteraceae bacterium]
MNTAPAGAQALSLRGLCCFRTLLGALLTLGFASVACAQTSTPTAEQLQIFNSLDSSQQQAILQALGTRSGNVSSGSQSGAQGGNNGGRTGGMTNARRTGTAHDDAFKIPVLKADDVMLVDLSFPQAAPTAASGSATVAASGAATNQATQTATVSRVADADAPLSESEKRKLLALIELVRSKNPYTLTHDGSLVLPGFVPISLLGLTVDQAAARIAAEPAFAQLQLKLSLLPLQKSGAAGLKPFGYDLFNEAPSTFAPVTDVPVPTDYVVGPGDELNVQLYGSQNRTLRLVVGRDGRISFPELGPISVGGQSFSTVQSELEARVNRQMIGVRASVSMGETRSIRIFVLGEANFPGSYTVSGLSTMTTALFASGGVKPIGSLRRIQLKRQGNVVRTLDLYDLLLQGDTSNDAKLMPGDVIYIPTVGATVAVDGEVKRPAIYELKGNQTAADAVQLAGGLTADADGRKVSLTRIDAQRQRVVMDVNLSAPNTRAPTLRNGDAISVARIPPTLESGITVEGHLYAPRVVAWREGLHLTDVIGSVDELKPNADIHYVLIRRELAPDRNVAVLSADLSRALAAPGGVADPVLQPRDRITVFDFENDRSRVIKPILDELRLQSHVDRPTEVVRVEGRIKVPGEYPLEPGMRISDLLRAGGNLQDAAFVGSAELTRYVEHDGKRTTQMINVDLAAIARGDTDADVVLQSSDLLNIKEVSQWGEHEQVVLQGEVRFPGTYPIQRGETLRSVIARAGGLTDLAFPAGSVFTREDLKEREQQQLDLLTTRMQSDLATLALQGAQANQAGSSQTLAVGQQLLAQLKSSKAVGRLVIDLDRVIASQPGSETDIILRNGDTLIVPRQRQEVTVIGEVQTATSHLYRTGLSRDDYISQSGGMTRKADSRQIYVVRANGGVMARNSSRWFQNGVRMQPGDTIVVPLDTERMPALPLWQAVTQIVYNIAIAAAAVNSF